MENNYDNQFSSFSIYRLLDLGPCMGHFIILLYLDLNHLIVALAVCLEYFPCLKIIISPSLNLLLGCLVLRYFHLPINSVQVSCPCLSEAPLSTLQKLISKKKNLFQENLNTLLDNFAIFKNSSQEKISYPVDNICFCLK